jgi:UDP-N-acetylglucosamine--N-acetylmuramyl-(pentapeptide) pyrophosphoryl-undecaprenol N-acetylglucosamine transferase
MRSDASTPRIKRPVLIMAGGTGGHIFPALAVANRLRECGVPLLWMGSRGGMENRIVPQAGIRLLTIAVTGLRGRGALALLAAPFRLLLALSQAVLLMLRNRPAAVLGMGGFVSGPGGLAAWLLRVPLLLHEQNAVLGLTNRLLAPLATRLMEAFPGAFNRPAAVHTGNPVRAEIVALAPPEERPREADRMHVLVLGGSQGARVLNDIVPAALTELRNDAADVRQPVAAKIDVWHQAGAGKLDDTRDTYARAGIAARVEAFIEKMDAAYAWADLVICRAGAMTIAELSAVGVASVLVPYPYAVDDHQTVNAGYLTAAQAALRVPENEFTAQRLAGLIRDLCAEPQQLLRMASAARRVGKRNATNDVAELCMEVAYA